MTAPLLALALAFLPALPTDTARSVQPLDGEWQFQKGDDLSWAAPQLDDSGWIRMPVPGEWETVVGDYDGFAWYRRTVELEPGLVGVPMGLSLATVGDAYEVYWNGVHVGGSGSLPPHFRESVSDPPPILIPQRVLDLSAGGDHVVAVRVYNEYAWGGLMSGAALARYDVFIQSRYPAGELVIGALVSFFLAIGLYHLAFFFRRRGARENLYFSALCVLMAVYGATYSSVFSDAVGERINPYRVGLIAVLLAAPVFVGLVHRLFDLTLTRGGATAVVLLLLALPVAALLPLRHLSDFNILVDIGFIVGLGIMLARMWVSSMRDSENGWILFAGTVAFAAAVGWDLLSEYGFVPLASFLPDSVPGLFWAGFLGLILSVGIATAGKWASAEVNALTDPLTTLARRHVFDDALEREVERLRRTGGSMAVAMIDLDHFKPVNDTYGHAVGDEVLSRVGQLIRRTARNIDLAARLGGEEFGVILYDSGMEGALSFAERLAGHLKEMEFPVPGGMLRVTASVGIAAGGGVVTPEGLLDTADAALYQAKREGRNRLVAVELPTQGAPVSRELGRMARSAQGSG